MLNTLLATSNVSSHLIIQQPYEVCNSYCSHFTDEGLGAD